MQMKQESFWKRSLYVRLEWGRGAAAVAASVMVRAA
jgi:hypothetical protein